MKAYVGMEDWRQLFYPQQLIRVCKLDFIHRERTPARKYFWLGHKHVLYAKQLKTLTPPGIDL
jgi:hypothetical protein